MTGITSPGIVAGVSAFFGAIKPTVDTLRKLGATDFTADVPFPNTTTKVPILTPVAAGAYNATSNNYTTGGSTTLANLTAAHYLQGKTLGFEDADAGFDVGKMKGFFGTTVASGVSIAVQNAVKGALDAVTTSTAVKLAATRSAADYLALGGGIDWLNKETSVLVVNGTEAGTLKGVFSNAGWAPTMSNIAEALGFKDVIVCPGMTAQAAIVPASSMGFFARVPAQVADYREAGVQTDDESGLSIGIVVANVAATNNIVVNADLWFGAATIASPAAATTAGVIKCGVAS